MFVKLPCKLKISVLLLLLSLSLMRIIYSIQHNKSSPFSFKCFILYDFYLLDIAQIRCAMGILLLLLKTIGNLFYFVRML